MGRDIHIHHELRRRLGPHEALRVDCGAVALWAWRVPINITAKVEPTQSLGAKVAFTGLGLRSRGRRTHPLLPAANTRGGSGISGSFTDASKVTKRPATS